MGGPHEAGHEAWDGDDQELGFLCPQRRRIQTENYFENAQKRFISLKEQAPFDCKDFPGYGDTHKIQP
jgi:hypothetical protein